MAKLPQNRCPDKNVCSILAVASEAPWIDSVSVWAAVRIASHSLDAVRANAAWLLHADQRPIDEVVAYVERWGLLPHGRAEKAVEFLTSPTWRAYISCYVEGYPLCRDFVAGDPTRFATLLTEQIVPADLVAP